MYAVPITDPADQRLNEFRDLRAADRRPDRPGGRGLVIAEGVLVVQRLAASTYPIRALLGTERRYAELEEDLAALRVPYYVTSAQTMAQTVGFHLNRGVLATADRATQPEVAELVGRATSLAVLEGIADHENIGGVFRNAAALGVDAVVLAAGCADPLYRRSVRVSMGHVLAVPFACWPGSIADLLELLHRNAFTTIGLTPSGSVQLRDLPNCRKVAILLGSEGPGLTSAALETVQFTARIAMSRGVDSLNVATAGAIAFAALLGLAAGG